MGCLHSALVCVFESIKIQESTAAANCCHCQRPRGCESQPDDLGCLASVCRLKSLVTFDALLYDLLNCVAFAPM